MPKDNALQDEVLHEIEQEVHDVLARGRREARRHIEEARRRKRDRYGRGLRKLEEELEIRRRRAVSRAELEGKKSILRSRREEVDSVFREALLEIETMSREDPLRYAELLWRSFTVCLSVMPAGIIRVRIGSEAEILRNRLKEEKGLEIEFSRSMEGVVLESEDGKIHCDASIGAALERLRRDREADIEEFLFGEKNEE